MLSFGTVATVKRIGFEDAQNALKDGFTSAVSHEITAKILTSVLNTEVLFNRVNLALNSGDKVIAIIPNFRAETAREFTQEEIGTNFSFFAIDIQ